MEDDQKKGENENNDLKKKEDNLKKNKMEEDLKKQKPFLGLAQLFKIFNSTLQGKLFSKIMHECNINTIIPLCFLLINSLPIFLHLFSYFNSNSSFKFILPA